MMGIVLDGKVSRIGGSNITLVDIGQLFKYLDSMCRCRNTSPHGLVVNDKEFIVAKFL